VQPIREIPHPQLPGVSVTVQQPRGADRIRLDQRMDRDTTVVTAVYELDGKTPIRKASGEVQTFIAAAPLTVESANARLKAYIIGMENVPTYDGATLNFPVERAKETAIERGKAIDDGLLFDDHLMCKVNGIEAAKLIEADAARLYKYVNPVPELQASLAAATDPDEVATIQKRLDEIRDHSVPMPYARYIDLTFRQDGFFDSDPTGNV
jgi:hypothetical protein